MLIKSLLKTLSIISLASVALTATREKNDCEAIKDYLSDYKENQCVVNNEGEMIKLNFDDYEIEEKNIKKVLSYNTLTELYYTVNVGENSEAEESKKTFPTEIGNLTNLVKLSLNYRGIEEFHQFVSHYRIDLDKSIIPKNSKDLKELKLSYLILDDNVLENISTLSNLEYLDLHQCDFKSFEKFSSDIVKKLNNLTKLKSITVSSDYGRFHGSISLPKNFISSFKNVKILNLDGVQLTSNQLDEITSLSHLEELTINFDKELTFNSFDKLSSLKKLSFIYLYYDEYDYGDDLDENEGKISFKLPKSLESLDLYKVSLSQDNIDVIFTLTNLKYLSINLFNSQKKLNFDSISKLDKLTELYIMEEKVLDEISDSILSLTNLKNLTLSQQNISKIPANIVNLKNLQSLELNDNKITKIPNELGELKNLEILNLNDNKISDTLNESLNDLPNLKEIYLRNNVNLTGKTLSNDSLEICMYEDSYDLCKSKEMKCFENSNYYEYDNGKAFKTCVDSNQKCGKGEGSCPSGQCCGKNGLCGVSDDYCSISSGCQGDYGYCNDECQSFRNYIKRNMFDVTVEYCNYNSKRKMTSIYIDPWETDLKTLFNQLKTYDQLTSLEVDSTSKVDGSNYVEQIVESFPNLKELILNHFSNDYFNDRAIYTKDIEKITELKNLESFICKTCDFNPGSNEESDISAFKNLKKFTQFYFISDREIGKFVNLDKVTTLKNITLGNYLITKNEVNELVGLSQLEELHLKNCYYDDDDLVALKKSKSLQTLEITNPRTYSSSSKNKRSTEKTSFPKFVLDIPNLKNLILKFYEFTTIPKEFEKLKSQLETLTIENCDITKIPDILSSFTHLTKLFLDQNSISEIPSSLGQLKNLKVLSLRYNAISELPNDLKNLSHLIELRLAGNELTKIPTVIENFKNLEVLDLYNNDDLDDEYPSYLNSFTNLREIYLSWCKNIRGQFLSNKSLEICDFDYPEYDLCYVEPITCKGEYGSDPELKPCNGQTNTTSTTKITTTTTTTTTTKTKTTTTTTKTSTKPIVPTDVSTNGKCGPKNGNTKCPSGQCCSKYGYCGTEDDYCLASNGCQSEFGKCRGTTSSDGKCGPENGNAKCPSGQCCSKYGYCGTKDDYCLASNGCQSEFGECRGTTSSDGKCGPKNGNAKCPSGQCCSKYGYCGTKDGYCLASNGCQSKYGKCL